MIYYQHYSETAEWEFDKYFFERKDSPISEVDISIQTQTGIGDFEKAGANEKVFCIVWTVETVHDNRTVKKIIYTDWYRYTKGNTQSITELFEIVKGSFGKLKAIHAQKCEESNIEDLLKDSVREEFEAMIIANDLMALTI